MEDQEILRRIEERLTRLEASVAQGAQVTPGLTNVAAPGGTVADPSPWGGGTIRPYPITTPPINPVADPAPWGGGVISRPPIISNPIGTFGDPAPWGSGVVNRPPVLTNPIGTTGYTAPIDLGQLSLSQLEISLHSLAAESTRLAAMEGMIKERIAALKKK